MAAVVFHVADRGLIGVEKGVPAVIERKLCLVGGSNEVFGVAVLTGLFVMSPGGVLVVGGNVMAGRSVEAYWPSQGHRCRFVSVTAHVSWQRTTLMGRVA
jgi:hypothetical protein